MTVSKINDQTKLLNDYIDLAVSRRGEFLNEMISLERILDMYISNYFAANKEDEELKSILRNNIGLTAKTQIATWIVKNKDPLMKRMYPTIKKDFIRLVDHRNFFAHAVVNDDNFESNINSKETILVSTLKSKSSTKVITEEVFDNLMASVGDYLLGFERQGEFSPQKNVDD